MGGGRPALGMGGGSWAPRCHVGDAPAGILEMFGELLVLLGDDEEMPRPGWEVDHPLGLMGLRARLMRFRPDGTAAYLEARLPGPGWGGTWELSIRGLELERSAVRARIALTAMPLLRDWIGRDTTAATRARQAEADRLATEAEELRAEGMTIEQAAEAMGRDETTIVRWLARKRGDTRIS